MLVFSKWANPVLFLIIFVFFTLYKIFKLMSLGLEPEVAEWKVKTIPLGYGGTPQIRFLTQSIFFGGQRLSIGNHFL